MKNHFLTPALLTLVLLSAFWAASAQDHIAEEIDVKERFAVLDESVAEAARTPGAIFTVNNDGDATDAVPGDGICETTAGGGICTLRAAVAEANALAGDDTINFAPNITLISVDGQIALTTNIVIDGPGAGVLTIRSTAAPSTTSRVFDITAGDVVTISGLTITAGGVSTGDGGGIRSAGTLTISDCVIHSNVNTGASSNGGGVRGSAGSTLTIVNTVIRDNRSANSGGLSFAGANLTVSNSVIRGNNATTGNGGGANIAATVAATIVNTTISGNSAVNSSGGFFITRGTLGNTTVSGNSANGTGTNGGGGIRIQAGANTVSCTSCTITGNTAPNAADGARSGIWHETGTLALSNSIVAANVAQDIQRDGAAVVTGSGFNLIGENTSVAVEFPEGLPNGTNYVGTDASPLDPRLLPLADNGGFGETHALNFGSPALDKGNSFGLTTDQRGFARPVDFPAVANTPGGDGADIGAFESRLATVSGRVFDSAGNPLKGAIVYFEDAAGTTRAVRTNTFGYFHFNGVESAQNYTFVVAAKGYAFAPQLVFVGDGGVESLFFSGSEPVD